MAKALSIDNMLEAATSLRLPHLQLHIKLLESAAHTLALAIAERTGIGVGDTTWEGEDMGGLCASFYAPNTRKKCPAAIHRGDLGGDWHINDTLNQPPTRSYKVLHEFDFEPTYVVPKGEDPDAGDAGCVTLGKDIPWEARRVLAVATAEFLSRSEDSR